MKHDLMFLSSKLFLRAFCAVYFSMTEEVNLHVYSSEIRSIIVHYRMSTPLATLLLYVKRRSISVDQQTIPIVFGCIMEFHNVVCSQCITYTFAIKKIRQHIIIINVGTDSCLLSIQFICMNFHYVHPFLFTY